MTSSNGDAVRHSGRRSRRSGRRVQTGATRLDERHVLERASRVGGNAGSFVIDGIPVDFGSHRLHPVTPPAVMADIRALLGDDLLDRPRHGRIRLRGRWVHFPLKPVDLLTRLPPAFMAGVMSMPFGNPSRHAGRAELCVDPRTRPRTHDLPRLLLSIRQQDLGLAAGRARSRAGQAPRVERIDRQDGASACSARCPGMPRSPAPVDSFIRAMATDRSATRFIARRSLPARRSTSRRTSRRVTVEQGRTRHVEVTVGGEARRLPADYVLSTIPVTVTGAARALGRRRRRRDPRSTRFGCGRWCSST